jgi:hypothetical protein
MAQTLQTCPPEIFEHILELLDTSDICNLRLTCATLATRAATRRFIKLFESLYVDLTPGSLLSLAKATQTDSLVCKVQTLYLAGIIREPDDSAIQSWERRFDYNTPTEEDVQLLRQSFDGLAKHKPDGLLPSLSLRVAVLKRDQKRDLPRNTGRGYPLKSLWQCTVNSFSIAVRALAASKLRVKQLNIFNDGDMQNCSLSCDQLNIIDWTDARVVDSLTAVTSLSISLMDRIFAFKEDEEIDEDLGDSDSEVEEADAPLTQSAEIAAASRQESNFSGLAKLIAVCPRLEDLELHYLSTVWPERYLSDLFPREDILQHVAGLQDPPVLRRCRIRGATVTEAHLLEFICRSRVTEVSVEVVHLAHGTLRPVIDYCISESACVAKLHIDTVFEQSEEGYYGLVHFLDEGKSAKYGGTFEVGTEILNREGGARMKPVRYYVRRPVPEGSPTIYNWNRLRREEYGY